MNLQGSIIEHQNQISQIYCKLENRFLENSIIHALWNEMAGDIAQQVNSLKVIPPSFWTQFKKDPDCHLVINPSIENKQSIPVSEAISLKESFSLALQIEETIILSIYVPIIRSLRKNWTNAALDFYILVKAHVARIVSVIESFAGDPLLIQSARTLLQKFEKAVQEHPANHKPVAPKAPITHAAPSNKPEEKTLKASKPSSPIKKHAKAAHNRAKPVVKKVEMTRRRAQR
jgi:hypothetical protein